MNENLPPSLRGLPVNDLPPSLRGMPSEDLPPSLRGAAPAQSAAIPRPIGVPEPARPAPREFTIGEKVKGAVETAVDLAAQIPAMLLGLPGGTIGGLVGAAVHGNPGTQYDGRRRIEDAAVEGQQRVHKAARGALQSMLGMDEGDPSEAGQAGIDMVGSVMQQAPSIVAAPRGLVGMSPAQPLGLRPALNAVGATVRNEATLVGDAVNAIPAVAERKVRVAKQAALDRPEMEGIRAAHEAGYKLSPKAARAGVAARSAETAAGSARLAQELAAHNAENTARKARRDVGLPDDVPATPEATQKIRDEAGRDYAVLRDVGEFTPDAQYAKDLDRILEGPKQVSAEFPGLLDSPVIQQVEGLKKSGPISTNAAIEAVKELRSKADVAYRAGNKKLGGTYRAAAEAVDNAMDRGIGAVAEKSGNPDLLGAIDRYRAARVRIAKTYLLDDAMDGKPGEVNAKVYARALDKGAKLTGDALEIANFAKQFGDEGLAAKKGRSGSIGPTFHDIVLGAFVHVPSAIAGGTAILARPVARAVLGSDFAQRRMAGSKPRPEGPAPEVPPPEPGLTQGFEDVPQGPGPAPQSPLGDITPDWITEPGAGAAARQEVVPTEGLVTPVDEAVPLRVRPDQPEGTANRGAGQQIPAVEGRPDLPDAMVVGAPAEAAATEATGAAIQTPDAALARRTQLAEVERVRAKAAESPEVAKILDEHTKAVEAKIKADAKKAQQLKDAEALRKAAGYTTDPELAARLRKRAEALEAPEKVPVGKVVEGAPKEKPTPPGKPVPKGEATELAVEKIEPENPDIPVGEATEVAPEVVEAAPVAEGADIAALRKKWPGLAGKPDAEILAAESWQQAQTRLMQAHDWKQTGRVAEEAIRDRVMGEMGGNVTPKTAPEFNRRVTEAMDAEAQRMETEASTPGTMANKRRAKQDADRWQAIADHMHKADLEEIGLGVQEVRDLYKKGRITDADLQELSDINATSRNSHETATRLHEMLSRKPVKGREGKVGKGEAANSKFEAGVTYTDAKGNKAIYQADGTWKPVK